MTTSYASIPILAGIALCGGGIGAVTLDLLDQRRKERARSAHEGRPAETVLIRTLSYVTGDPKSSKAWKFLVGCALYAALGGTAGFLQADVLAAASGTAEGGGSGGKTKGALLVVYPIVVGLSGVLLVLGVRLLPYDKYPRAGTVTHVMVAGCFQMFAVIYCFTAVQLATAVFGEDATITAVRRVFAYIGVACIVLSFLFGGYVMGKTAQLVQHDKAIASSQSRSDANGTLTPKEVWAIKCWTAALGSIQLSLGVAVSAVTATGAAEAKLFS